MVTSSYDRLVALLNGAGARYRFIDHAAEGRTELVSALRGHDPKQAAKCLVLMVKLGKRSTKFVLAVMPGAARADIDAIKRLYSATYVGFAPAAEAERLSGCVPGTVLPFPFTDEVELLVDPSLLENPEIYFNAGRLDRSVALATEDYVRIVAPRLERIAAAREPRA